MRELPVVFLVVVVLVRRAAVRFGFACAGNRNTYFIFAFR